MYKFINACKNVNFVDCFTQMSKNISDTSANMMLSYLCNYVSFDKIKMQSISSETVALCFAKMCEEQRILSDMTDL